MAFFARAAAISSGDCDSIPFRMSKSGITDFIPFRSILEILEFFFSKFESFCWFVIELRNPKERLLAKIAYLELVDRRMMRWVNK